MPAHLNEVGVDVDLRCAKSAPEAATPADPLRSARAGRHPNQRMSGESVVARMKLTDNDRGAWMRKGLRKFPAIPIEGRSPQTHAPSRGRNHATRSEPGGQDTGDNVSGWNDRPYKRRAAPRKLLARSKGAAASGSSNFSALNEPAQHKTAIPATLTCIVYRLAHRIQVPLRKKSQFSCLGMG